MKSFRIHLFVVVLSVVSCAGNEKQSKTVRSQENSVFQQLKERAEAHRDSARWDKELFVKDQETYQKYASDLQSYPIRKTPFPVADYDYAVSSEPFDFQFENHLFKGVSIGEYPDPESEDPKIGLTILILAKDPKMEENTLVESRNYPYLTAEGIFQSEQERFDWVFAQSPDGFATLIVNMKLFDLRFGKTVVIFPGKNHAFTYLQLKLSRADFKTMKAFQTAVEQDANFRKAVNQLE